MASDTRGRSRAARWRGIRIYTIGHSTRSIDELVKLLRAFDVSVVVDIRTIPRSRHNPQYDRTTLRSALHSRHLRYVHLGALGGLRHSRRDSPNGAWRNASFRGFADYMLTEEFEVGLEKLRDLTTEGTLALMCAEAVPWRCHRWLIADALTARGAHVEHITSARRSQPHALTEFAHVDGTHVTYPGAWLSVQAPFHLEATVRVLQRRPTNLVDVWEDGRYLRVLRTGTRLFLVEVSNRGTTDAPELGCRVLNSSKPPSSDLLATLRRMLGLDIDPGVFRDSALAEPRLRETAIALRGMRPPRFASLFETFANVVPFQQVSLDAGVAIVRRLVERFGAPVVHDGRRYLAFPTADTVAAVRPAAIRQCGLSAQKASTLHLVARAIVSGELNEAAIAAMSTQDAQEALVELPGIGPWSASLVLLRGFGRLDVFPPGDVGVERGLGALTHLGKGALTRLVQRFGDYRGYLYFYALGGSLLRKGLIQAAPSL